MKTDNPLSREFLTRYPAEAAQALESVSVEHVAAFYCELPPQLVAPVMAFMLPQNTATCFEVMPPVSVAKFLTELPVSSAARIYRLLVQEKQNEILGHLPESTRSQLRRHLAYPDESVGVLLNPKVDMLPVNISVADAIRRIERLDHAISCEIFIVDEQHHLMGSIELGKLLVESNHAYIRDIMERKTQQVSIHASAQSLSLHPGWMNRRRLPVVERDNTLLGTLDYSTLQGAMGERRPDSVHNSLEGLSSLASLYWLSMAQLMDSVLDLARSNRREKQ